MTEINNKTDFSVDEDKIYSVVGEFLDYYDKKDYHLSIAIVGPLEIQKLNKKYRDLDVVTDILSFESENSAEIDFPDEEEKCLGELVICYERIIEQAKKYSDNTEEEFVFILIHGLLHLIGFEDESEDGRKLMEKRGNDFIKTLE